MRMDGDMVSHNNTAAGENMGANMAAPAEMHVVTGSHVGGQKSIRPDGHIARDDTKRADDNSIGHFATDPDLGRWLAQDGKLSPAVTQHVGVFAALDRVPDGADEKIIPARLVIFRAPHDGQIPRVHSPPVIKKTGKPPSTIIPLRCLDSGGKIPHLPTKGTRAHDDEIFFHGNGINKRVKKNQTSTIGVQIIGPTSQATVPHESPTPNPQRRRRSLSARSRAPS